MPDYSYSAIDSAGTLRKGTVFALDETGLEEQINQTGLTLIRCKKVEKKRLCSFLPGGKITTRALIEFYYRLSQTLEMGLPILTALDENSKMLPSARLKKLIHEIKLAVESGNTFHEAMSRYPSVFHKLELGLVKMGEKSGNLSKCLRDLAGFLEWREEIRSTIKRALVYPCFIFPLILAVVGVWVGYVLPQMAAAIMEMNVPLPITTRAVLHISNFARSYWPVLIGAGVFCSISLYIFYKTERGKYLFDRYLLKIPLAGTIASSIVMARLSNNFATLYNSGMTLDMIFEMLTRDVLGNRFIEDRLALAYEEIQRGQTIAQGLESAGGFPSIILGAIRNGESTGTLDETFRRLGEYYNAGVRKAVQSLVSVIEPVTIVILGGVFGIIVLSILLPLYDVINQFGKMY
jgi:type IV pilus assembly protein PilC